MLLENQSHYWQSKIAALLFDPGHKSNTSPSTSRSKPDSAESILPGCSDFLTERSSVFHPTTETVFSNRCRLRLLKDEMSEEEAASARFFLHWRSGMGKSLFVDDPATEGLTNIKTTQAACNDMASALKGCLLHDDKLAFLTFHLDATQDLSTQTRTEPELTSVCFLSSWLMAHALKTLSDHLGPDHVVYPYLRGNPLFDFLCREHVYDMIRFCGDDGESSLWERMGIKDEKIRVASLPNRFVALVPAAIGVDIAHTAERAARDELRNIMQSSLTWLEQQGHPLPKSLGPVFEQQLRDGVRIVWQVTPWDDSPSAERVNSYLRSVNAPSQDAGIVRELFSLNTSRKPDPDVSSEKASSTTHYTRPDFGWDYEFRRAWNNLESRLQLHDFSPCPSVDDKVDRKSLNKIPELNACFDDAEWFSAITLCTRIWHQAYLGPVYGLLNLFPHFSLPRMFAVLLLRADAWVPQNSVDADRGILKWFSSASHLQISRTLTHFAIDKVRSIVKSANGRVVQASGEKVIVIMPAGKAPEYAFQLRNALRCPEYSTDQTVDVSGPGLDASVGIALAHNTSPLSHVVRKAKEALKRAETDYDQSSFSMSLYKRSGEIIEWGGLWDSGALASYNAFLDCWSGGPNKSTGFLTKRFPYALTDLLAPYEQAAKFNATARALREMPLQEILWSETEHVLKRQIESMKRDPKREARFKQALRNYLGHLCKSGRQPLPEFTNLFRVAAFLSRV